MAAAQVRGPLSGVRVVELSDPDSAAQWCGSLLADAGAKVLLAEQRPDSPDTPADPRAAYQWRRRTAGKAVTTGDPISLLDGADAVLVSDGWAARLAATGLPPAELSRRHPALVVCCLTGYGLTGPLAGRPASELLLQAVAGVAATNGNEGQPPLQAGVPVATIAGCMFGAMGLVAALYERHRSGRGQLVDVAAFDAVLCCLGTLLPAVFLTGARPARIGNRHSMTAPWNAYPTSDGWAVLTTMGQALWTRLATGIGRPELVEDPRFADAPARVANAAAIDAEIAAWTRRHTTEQVLAWSQRHQVPAGSIPELPEVLADPQVRARGLVRTDAGVAYPAGPLRLPVPGGDGGQPAPAGAGADGPPPAAADGPPLAGVRVLELGAFTAAPLAGRLLGALGADVLKVEPPGGDNCRHLAQRIDGTGYLYYLNNTDKRGRVADLADPDQLDRLRTLARHADLVLTNLSAEALAKHRVDDASLRDPAGRMVYCSVSGYGLTGPRGGDKAFDTVIQAYGGVMALTGWPDGPPLKVAISWADVLGAYQAALGSLLALYARLRTGRGMLVDIGLLDGMVWSTQQRWAEFATGGTPSRLGNAHPTDAPHGIYRCRDGWVAVQVATAEQWHGLAALLGGGWREPALAGAGHRRACGSELDRAVEGWTGTRRAGEAAERLRAAGVPAEPVNDLPAVVDHPQTAARKMLLDQHTPGGAPLRVLSVPWRFSRSPVAVTRTAPPLAGPEPAGPEPAGPALAAVGWDVEEESWARR